MLSDEGNAGEWWKTTIGLRACLHEGGGPQIGEVTPLGGVKKITLIYMQSYNPAISGCTFSRLLNGR